MAYHDSTVPFGFTTMIECAASAGEELILKAGVWRSSLVLNERTDALVTFPRFGYGPDGANRSSTIWRGRWRHDDQGRAESLANVLPLSNRMRKVASRPDS